MHPNVVGAVLVAVLITEKAAVAMASNVSFVTPPSPTASLRLPQGTPTLTERADQIDTCRGTTSTPVTIYRRSALEDAIGTVPANSSVTLTGIFGAGIVQIKAPQLGWVSASTLITDCGAASGGGLPPDFDTNPQYCRRLRSVQVDGNAYADLNSGLVAREAANGDFQSVGDTNQPDGPGRAAIVRFTGRATDLQDAGGRRWIRIKYTSQLGLPRVGWVPNGATGINRNLAACSSGQN